MPNAEYVPIRTAYEVCFVCSGSGLQMGMDGIVTCYSCRGDCVLRLRDERGRFITREVPNDSSEAP